MSHFVCKRSEDDNKLVIKKIADSTAQQNQKTYLQRFAAYEIYNSQIAELQQIKMEMQDAEKLMATVYKTAPDGGNMLYNHIESLRDKLKNKAKFIAGLYTEQPIAAVSAFRRDFAAIEETSSINFETIQNLLSNKPKCQQDDSDKYTHGMDIYNAENIPSWDRLFDGIEQMEKRIKTENSLTTFRIQKAVTLEKLKELHGSLENRPEEAVLADDPDGLAPNISLKRHQKHALAWLKWRESNTEPSGGILADDMGLGKTLTMISLILDCKNSQEDQPLEECGEYFEFLNIFMQMPAAEVFI